MSIGGTKKLIFLAAGGLVMAGIAGASFLAGHIVTRHELPLHRELERAERMLDRLVSTALGRGSHQEAEQTSYAEDYDSIFLRLRGEGTRVEVQRGGAGGGITSMGGDILLLTHEGTIFAASGPSDVRSTSIAPPENGFDDYLRIAESEDFREFRHVPSMFRYNDILFVARNDGGSLLLSYTEFDAEAVCYRNAVASIDADTDNPAQLAVAPEDWSVIYRTEPCLPLKRERRAIEGHVAGGRMALRPPNALYLANGDYHWDGVRGPRALSQDPDYDYGKVVVIDLSTGDARQVSSGHRNPQGIAVDRAGQIWLSEHGPRAGDELNLIEEGANYGWPLETIGTSYDGTPWPLAISFGRHETYTAPVFAWLPAIAPSALTLVEGFDAAWDGDLLLSSLRDQSLHRIRTVGDRIKFAERIEVGKRIRYVHQHTDGRLVLWTDDKYLIFISIVEDTFLARIIEEHLMAQEFSEFELAQVRDALEECLQCHALETSFGEGNAPSLAGVYDAPIASTDFRWYSAALADRGGRWTRENLAAYLADPGGWAPGTIMPNPGLDPFQIDAVIDVLSVVSAATE